MFGSVSRRGWKVTSTARGTEVRMRGPREGSLFVSAQGVAGRWRRLVGVGQPCQSLSFLSYSFHP